jgi:glycosyltransferase involved in cell wall biosynthesis
MNPGYSPMVKAFASANGLVSDNDLAPRVSVIMPCFNHARFLRGSVNGILQQTYTNLELIIVEDCSSDNSWQLIQSLVDSDPRIRVLRHERNQGASRTRNDALRIARGAFIGFCDADDIWERDKIGIQLNLLNKHPEYDGAYCDAIIVDENGLPTGKRYSDWFPPPKIASGRLFGELVLRNFINMQSVLLRKECVQRVGEFDEGIKWVEDWWYWVRISRDHRLLYSQEPLARYRVHGKSTNVVQKRGYRFNRYKVFKRILRHYPDISRRIKADILYKMGFDLCGLGKRNAGRHLFWNAIEVALRDIRAFNTLWKAAARMIINVRTT